MFNMIYISYQQLIYYFISESNSLEGHSCLLQTPLELENKHYFRYYSRTNCGNQLEGMKLLLPQAWFLGKRKLGKCCEIEERSSPEQEGTFCCCFHCTTEMDTGIPDWAM